MENCEQPWVKHFCGILSKSNAYGPRNNKNFLPARFFTLLAASQRLLLSQSSQSAVAWKLFAFKPRLAQATGAARAAAALQPLPAALLRPLKTTQLSPGGEGTNESPKLAEFTQSHPRSIIHLIS